MENSTDKKGSSLKIRVISGVVIGVLLTFMLVTGAAVTALFLFVTSIIAYRELANVTGFSGGKREDGRFSVSLPEGVGYLGIVLHYALLIVSGGNLTWFAFSAMAVFCSAAFVYVVSYPKYSASQFIFAIFSFLYAPVMLSFVYLLRILPGGNYLGWVPFVAWICDTSAYFAGRAFGRHKLSPILSPHKTVEGAVGGVLGSMVAGIIFAVIYAHKLPQLELPYIIGACIVITAVGGTLSQVGDLTASGIKRQFDVKDYGTIIPGHGGILDRFDSVIFISPFMYFLAALLLHGGIVR